MDDHTYEFPADTLPGALERLDVARKDLGDAIVKVFKKDLKRLRRLFKGN